MVLVDTSVWVDYLRGTPTPETDWLDVEVERQRIGLTDLNLCEILQGVGDNRYFVQVRREMFKFEIFTTGSVELAVSSAENYRALRAKGYTVRKTIDCLIATFCLQHDHALLHKDRDFVPFEQELGLKVIHC